MQQTRPLDQTLRDHTLALVHRPAIAAIAHGPTLLSAWAMRAQELTAYAATLDQQRQPTVLRALLHDHHVRAVGVDPTFEKETFRLARAVARRHLALADTR
ncbi:hypothetical protein [Actinokineospora inagensis]|uniref:hypothetical protein n=1 Tax=Actinokineospora inagensis TaxID=103730 RepID=UPI0012FAFDA9|nr:hypothetical protein [Actinokineospora inagensis]